MTRWETAATFALFPESRAARSEVALEDHYNTRDFLFNGVPDPWKWVDELVARAADESLKAVS